MLPMSTIDMRGTAPSRRPYGLFLLFWLFSAISVSSVVSPSLAQQKPAPPPAKASPAPAAKAPTPPQSKPPQPDPKSAISPQPSAIRSAPDHPLAAVTALAFSPDGKRLAVGTFGQVVIYETTTWQPAGVFRGLEDTARALAFRPDGQQIAVGDGLPGESGRVVFCTAAGQLAGKWPDQFEDDVESVCWSHDGKELLVGANDHKARFCSSLPAATGKVLDEHNDRVQAVAFPPQPDTIFVTGGLDKIVKVWDAKKAQTIVNFDQCQAGVTGLAFLNNGNQFVGASQDGHLRWWGVYHDDKRDAWGGYIFRDIGAHEGGVLALAMSADGKRLITGGQDSRVCVWDPNNGGRQHEFKDSPQPVYAVALSPDGKVAAGGGRDGIVRVWDVDGNKLTNTIVPPALPAPPPPPARKHTPAKKTGSRAHSTPKHNRRK